jgi:hypothetical protein
MRPYDTIPNIGLQAPKRGFIKTGTEIVKRETALGLYKGLGAVITGIVPKMAIRFTSYEWYKQKLADQDGMVTSKSTFMGKPHQDVASLGTTPRKRKLPFICKDMG